MNWLTSATDKASWLTATFISAGTYLALSLLALPYKMLDIEDVSNYNEESGLNSGQVENMLVGGDKKQLVQRKV